jgi:DNA-binding NtrC family response regulator
VGKILLVDDDPGVLFTLKELLCERGHDVTTARSGDEALARLEDAEAVLTDLSMPGMDGLELLAAIRGRDPVMPVVLLTAHGSEKVAVSAIKAGAYDYLKKPFDIEEIELVMERALEARRLRQTNRRLVAERAVGRRIIAESRPMKRLLDAVERVGARDVTVLIRGETGTGKEFVASLLHAHSARVDKPLVRFNCAAIPAELAEAELFGHMKGAFTGAHAARRGFFAEADGGTLVLDEVGELPLGVQAKLLRALQEGEIQPVGSARIERVDVRIVASTNRDLQAEARAGRFREDLYYRLAVVELLVAPLRDRREDIPALAAEFARRYGDKFGLGGLVLAPEVVKVLEGAPWPGNVRQLENTVARLAALSAGGVIGMREYEDALGRLDGGRAGRGAARADSSETGDVSGETDGDVEVTGEASVTMALPLREQVEAFERNLVARALEGSHGNQSEAARRLGISRVTLIDKMKKYGLAPRRGGEA